MIFKHKSVLLEETIDSLNIKPDGIYVDGTLGGGGHASEVCRRLGEHGRLIGFDQDQDAITAAGERLAEFGDKVTIVRSNYEQIKSVLQELGIEKVDGIYLDLGVSSYQLYTAERGFSYREDAPLDMRMDQRQSLTARDIVNEYSEVPSTEAGIYDVQVAVSCYDGYLRLYPLHYGQCVSREPQIMGERTFKISTEVTLSATDGAVIYYTDNLTDDPSQFTQYIAPLTLTTTTTLRAYAREWGKQPSRMCEATFTRQDSGIETVPADQCDSIRYITFQGLELSAPPASGPYIELRNGCARKILRR